MHIAVKFANQREKMFLPTSLAFVDIEVEDLLFKRLYIVLD